MSENKANGNFPDAADSSGPEKLEVGNTTSTPSTFTLDDFEKPPAPPLVQRTSSTSMPSLSSFASLGLSDDEGEDSVVSGEDLDASDYEDHCFDNSPQPEPRSMPMIPGLEVSKDARPGFFLAELAVSADSLVNKRTPEKELGARWKDGSIPIATLMKQKKHEVQKQIKETGEEKRGRGRRRSGRGRLRSKSPPPPVGGTKESADDSSNNDGSDLMLPSIVAPVRPVRQVSVCHTPMSPPMSPIFPGSVFSPHVSSASVTLPTKPERKVSMNMMPNMTRSRDPLITPSPGTHADKSIESVVGKSLPSIQLSDKASSPGAIPPLKPTRQTTRNSFEGIVETIAEDSNGNDRGEDDFHPEEADDTVQSPGAIPPLKPMRQTTRNSFEGIVETIAEDSNINHGEEDDIHPEEADTVQSPGAIPPLKPMRQTTRNLSDCNCAETIVLPIAEDCNNEKDDGSHSIMEELDKGSLQGSVPPLKPMRQTTRNFLDSVVDTIIEEEDDIHPIMEGTSDQLPANDMPSQPQRRETYYDENFLLEAVEEHHDPDGNLADEMPPIEP